MTRNYFIKPIVYAIGLSCLLSLSGCVSKKTPTETTQAFWSAMAKNNVESAKEYCSSQSQTQFSANNALFKKSTLTYGKIIIDGNQASVDAKIIPPFNQRSSITTFLIKESDIWKVDCQRSTTELKSNFLVEDFFKNLNDLGQSLNKQLEQQLPLIEKEIGSFTQELEKQLKNFESELKKSLPKKQQDPYQDSI